MSTFLELRGIPFFNPQKAPGEWVLEDMAIEEDEKKVCDLKYVGKFWLPFMANFKGG